jgi:two-component system chemotaxis sensor kinase CheA
MAIIDGLLLRVGAGAFVVQLRSVVESLRPTAAQIGTVFGRTRVLQFRGGTIPLVALAEVLDVDAGETDPTRGIVVVVESGGTTIGIVVDELVADTQVVVKSLEANYKALEGLAGATVLGDGTIALILDVGALARRAMSVRTKELRAVA